MASPSNPIVDPLVTALRENEELRNSLAQLETALQSLQQRATQSSDAAQTAADQLQQFIYAASHDLQEPLRAILSYAQLLERELTDDPQARQYAAFIRDGGHRMKDLLQRLLLYSRAGTSRRRTTGSLNVPLQQALLKLAPEIGSTAARIVRAPLPEVTADHNEMALVFENLIENALRFRGAEAPEIDISAEQGSDECRITLRDNGAGFEPRFCEHVLLPFKRLHGKQVPGAGLGLSVVDKIIRAHGGRLWLESEPAKGTAVHFTLPA